MGRSPGHQKWPQHRVDEGRLPDQLRVEANGEIVAESDAVIRVKEEGSPDRYYFPRSDVRIDVLERSQATSHCPFKGVARYFHLSAGGRKLVDLAWSYEDPYEEHRALQNRLAFREESPQIRIVAADGQP